MIEIKWYIKKPIWLKGPNFFSEAKFYGHSGQIILKRVGMTGRRASKCRQIFYKPLWKGSRRMLWYLYANLSMLVWRMYKKCTLDKHCQCSAYERIQLPYTCTYHSQKLSPSENGLQMEETYAKKITFLLLLEWVPSLPPSPPPPP